jgi:outer membrane protein assembly factor BamB
VEKLIDGQSSGSMVSVMWPAGVSPTVTLELPTETEISSVVLREWHMNETWDLGGRKLEVSSDGFRDDARPIAAPFKETGTQRWGGNVNTLFEAPVQQQAKQVRLTLSPARQDSSVYVAEAQLMGTRPGVLPQIRALAIGSLTPGGKAVVAATDSGGVRAADESGKVLWSYQTEDRSPVNSLACADVNGDGVDEVLYGADGERLGLLSADGKELWHVQPPAYRGIPADVMTVFAADVNGDGRPEIVCGCKDWLYCAYDAAGKLLWKHVIYAHSATVGCAADLDGDKRDEVVAGNAYYSLNLIDHDGAKLFEGSRLGPEQTAVAAFDVDGDGKPEVLAGTDLGELICFDATGKRLWEANVGDKVTRLLAADLNADGKPEVLCAAESANVFAFDGAGKLLWRAALPDGVGDLAVHQAGGTPQLIAAAGSAGIAVLSASGEVLALGPTPGRAHSLVVTNSQAIAATDRGTLAAFTLP